MLNELKAYSNLDCYVTGSNSKMLSSDIATEFRGRSSQIKIYPFSFVKFYSYKGGVASEALDEYMLYGGMPGLIHEPKTERKRVYFKNLYDEIYIKDLIEHAIVQRQDVLEEVLDYLASSIGSLTNANKISDDTIAKYLKHTIDAFLIFEARRYDVKGRRY